MFYLYANILFRAYFVMLPGPTFLKAHYDLVLPTRPHAWSAFSVQNSGPDLFKKHNGVHYTSALIRKVSYKSSHTYDTTLIEDCSRKQSYKPV